MSLVFSATGDTSFFSDWFGMNAGVTWLCIAVQCLRPCLVPVDANARRVKPAEIGGGKRVQHISKLVMLRHRQG